MSSLSTKSAPVNPEPVLIPLADTPCVLPVLQLAGTPHAGLVALEMQGYKPGAPEHVTPETIAIDRAAYRRRRCPVCWRKQMTVSPYTSPTGEYALILACTLPTCEHAEVA